MFELLRHRLRHNRRVRALWIPSVAIAVASTLLGLLVWTLVFRIGSAEEIADRLSARGAYEASEIMYWRALQRDPELETVIHFIDNYAELRTAGAMAALLGGSGARPVVGQEQVQSFIRRLPEPQRTLAIYWYEVRTFVRMPDESGVLALSRQEPPVRWAHHLLGRKALLEERYLDAATHFEAEGLAYPGSASEDLSHALALWAAEEQWDAVRQRLRDPRYRNAAGLPIRLGLAIHDRDWPSILLLVWPAGFHEIRLWPVLLAAVAAVLWLSIASKMGRVGEGVPGRRRLYVLSFLAGILSIYPTLVVITLEDIYLGLRQTGDPIADAIFFTFGVGLREEACKILLFLPLLPILKRRGSRLEALACGALVGLGFAAEENIGYFQSMSLPVAIERFLTANFLHMALTGLIAVSLYDGARARDPLDRFDVIFPLAVLFHGAYDFFLSNRAFGDLSMVAMVLFILLAQRFLRQVVPLLPSEVRQNVLSTFVVSLFCLSGVSYVYAAAWVGPAAAVMVVAGGFLGVAILLLMFLRELA